MKKGDAATAAKHYSRMLLLDAKCAVAYANRAQANLLLKEYRGAICDATAALRLDPTHVKSWMRRATARTSLGMHEAAARDLRVAHTLEPSNKAVLAELRKAEETCRSSQKRLPDVAVRVAEME
jgi:tetratricopeptide (TPR) repeat protein